MYLDENYDLKYSIKVVVGNSWYDLYDGKLHDTYEEALTYMKSVRDYINTTNPKPLLKMTNKTFDVTWTVTDFVRADLIDKMYIHKWHIQKDPKDIKVEAPE